MAGIELPERDGIQDSLFLGYIRSRLRYYGSIKLEDWEEAIRECKKFKKSLEEVPNFDEWNW